MPVHRASLTKVNVSIRTLVYMQVYTKMCLKAKNVLKSMLAKKVLNVKQAWAVCAKSKSNNMSKQLLVYYYFCKALQN
jgi:hypothetical protein